MQTVGECYSGVFRPRRLAALSEMTPTLLMEVPNASHLAKDGSRGRWSDWRSASGDQPYTRVHDMRFWLALAIGALMPILAAAQPALRLIVGELFTSEGCSSYAPADAKVAEVARTRPDLLMLTFQLIYWNYLGWHDPYSFDAATQRKRRYVTLGVSPEVYTPALIVDGKPDAVRSDTATVDRILRQATQSLEMAAPIDAQRGPAELTVSVGAGTGHAALLLIG
jgi:hypothetical protein